MSAIFPGLVLLAAVAPLQPRLLTITDGARARLAEYAKASAEYRPVSGRTAFFARTQLKYGLQRDDFLHNWYERPLYQDTRYAAENVKGKWLNLASWRKQVEIGKLSLLDGFAFFPSTRNRAEAYAASLAPGGAFGLMPEMTAGSFKDDGGVGFCRQALASPHAFRIDGRVVLPAFPGYPCDKLGPFVSLKAKLAELGLSDQVALVPYASVFTFTTPFKELNADRLDEDLLELGRERVRQTLRQVDGFTLVMTECKCDRKFNREFAEKVYLPILHSVFCEPEFRGKKLLGVVMSQGHENCYRWTGIHDSNGTQTGRDEFETILKLRPDFVVCAEWDEEDENTHFRPTLSNGHVTQRLYRYYVDKINGRVPRVFPGDDTSVPNLVLSYRKTLQAGELLSAEIVNIPDDTAPDRTWSVSLRWKTPSGKTVASYGPEKLDAATCSSLRFETPVTELLRHQVLLPELSVSASGRTESFSEGFWPVDLAANRNYDYKWMRVALREISSDVSVSVSVGKCRPDGTYFVSGEIEGPTKFRSVEILEGAETVYMHDAPAAGPDEIGIRISLQGMNGSADRNRLNGMIGIRNAKDLWCQPIAVGRVQQKKGGWVLRDMPLPERFAVTGPTERTFFAKFSASSAESAEVVIDLKGVFEKRVRVKDLLSREGIGFAGPSGAYLWIERYYKPFSIPAPIGTNRANFSFALRPKDPNGVLRIQAVDEDFRLWRGFVASLNQPTGKEISFHVFERDTETVKEVKLDSSRIVSLDYDFSGTDGDICWSGADRLLPIVLGSSILTPVGIGAADGGGQTSPVRGSKFVANPAVTNVAPRLTSEPEGFRSLVFGGTDYAGSGLQVLPQFAGFSVELQLKPEAFSGKQGLVGTGNLGFELWLEDGLPHAYLNRGTQQRRSRRNDAEGAYFTGPRLELGKWQTLRFVTDQTEAYLEVDGVKGEIRRFSDWRYNPCVIGIGKLATSGLEDAAGSGFFQGRISRFKVSPK